MNWDDPEIQNCPGCGRPLADQVCTYERVDETGLIPGATPSITGIDCRCGATWRRGEGWSTEIMCCDRCRHLEVGKYESDTGYIDIGCQYEDRHECGMEEMKPMFPKYEPIDEGE